MGTRHETINAQAAVWEANWRDTIRWLSITRAVNDHWRQRQNSKKAIRLVISRIFHLKSTCRWEKSRHLSNYPTKNGSWDSAAEFSGDLIKNDPKSLLPQRMSDILGVCHNWNWIMQIKFQKVRLWLFQCISSPDKSIRHMDDNLQARLAIVEAL